MSFLAPTPADEQRRRGLRRMRLVALSLLILAAAIYAVTLRLDHSGGWGYVNTGAEAAMVGALADWFAVTALFRHPLGLPIPHTAIIPQRKNEIGRNLQDFVADNFLTEEIARERLRTARVADRLGAWLNRPEHRARVLQEATRALRAGLGRLSDDEVRTITTQFLLPRLAREPISPIAGSLLSGVVEERTHHGLVDIALQHFHAWLSENPTTFAALIGERAPWWSPPWLDDRVIGWSYQQVLDWIADIRDNEAHPARGALDNLLRRLAEDLQSDDEVIARAERGDELLQHLGRHLREDETWRVRVEERLGEAVAFAVNTYGHELAEVISVTVDRWDGREAAERIELHVGRDLQFIRINGTIVGALAGVVIHALSQLAG